MSLTHADGQLIIEGLRELRHSYSHMRLEGIPAAELTQYELKADEISNLIKRLTNK